MLSFIGSPGLVSWLESVAVVVVIVVVVVGGSGGHVDVVTFVFFYCFVYESRMLLRVFDVGGGTSYFP